MKSLSKGLSAFLGLALIVALGLGGYSAVAWMVAMLSMLDFQVATVMGIASVVMFSGASIIAISIQRVARQQKANRLHPERATTYQFFTDLWTHLLQKEDTTESEGRDKLCLDLQTLDRVLLVYGSPNVVKLHAALRALEREGGSQQVVCRRRFAEALLAIRADLGAERQGLTAEDVQNILFGNAIEEPVVATAQVSTEPLRATLASDTWHLPLS